MGEIFTITPAIKGVVQQALDDLITELGKECQIVYPPKWVACSNCIWDPIGNKSSNRWRSGGPVQFSVGSTCPLCDGVGRKAQEISTDTVKMLCQFEPKRFWTPVPKSDVDIRVPFNIIQSKGYMTDLPKVLKCDHIIFEIPLQGVIRQKYRLLTEPGDKSNIIQGRYFVATWQRWNG